MQVRDWLLCSFAGGALALSNDRRLERNFNVSIYQPIPSGERFMNLSLGVIHGQIPECKRVVKSIQDDEKLLQENVRPAFAKELHFFTGPV
jgi:hypothetical protein